MPRWAEFEGRAQGIGLEIIIVIKLLLVNEQRAEKEIDEAQGKGYECNFS